MKMLRQVFVHRPAKSRGDVIAKGAEAVQEEKEEEHDDQHEFVDAKEEIPVREEDPERQRRLPNYAMKCHEFCLEGIRRRNRNLVIFYIEFVTLMIGAVICAVLYGHYYKGSPSLQDIDPVQISLYAATILIPAISVILQGKEIKLPLSDNYRKAATQIEGELYKFRSQAAPYEDNLDVEQAKESFLFNLREILGSLQEDMDEDKKTIPQDDDEEFWGDGGSSVTESIEKEESEALVKTKKVKEAAKPKETVISEEPSVYYEEFSELPRGMYYKDIESQQKKKKKETETTPLLDKTSKDKEKEADIPTGEAAPSDAAAVTPEEVITDDEPIEEDDGVSILTPSKYLHVRFNPWLKEQKHYHSRLQLYQVLLVRLVQIDNLCCVGLAFMSMQWCIPMLLVFAAALDRIVQVSQLKDRIDVANQSIVDVEKVDVWWQEVTASTKEEEDPGNESDEIVDAKTTEHFKLLVEETESIIFQANKL